MNELSIASNLTPMGSSMGNTPTEALLFWIVAILCVVGSLFVITRHNLVTAAVGLIGVFFATALIYLMLFAPFLAVIQILVYSGAVMVLFVFVVMICNCDTTKTLSLRNYFERGAVSIALMYLLMQIVHILWSLRDNPVSMSAEELAQRNFGSTKSIGSVLFYDYLIPFEAVSLVLLIAVVGSLALVDRTKTSDKS